MKVKKMGRLSLGLIMLAAAMGTAAMAQDEPVFTADISIDYATMYVWRGIPVNRESVLQPAVAGSAYGFTGSIWANIDMTDYAGTAGEFSEIDYALDYSGSMGESVVGYSVGIIHYIFPTIGATDASTTEIYGGLSFDVPLSPFVTVYGDVNAIDGAYVQFGVGHSLEMEMAPDYSMGIDLSASFAFGSSGYNSGYFGIDEAKWNDFTIGIGVPFSLKHVSLTPSFNMSTMLSEEIGDSLSEQTNYWFALSLGKSF
ncbi:MAG: hypothetical protein JW793_03535 [Acidobacteria bacterium]|nr:hypothetical protein [Acidobacteriota bacterium]